MRFRKKPIEIEAIQWTGDNLMEMSIFVTGNKIHHKPNAVELLIPTLEGDMTASKGDWIIRGINGEFYPCKPNIFEKTYERVEE